MSGEQLLRLWVLGFIAAILAAGIVTGFFKARKMQPKGFKWSVFRCELFGATATAVVSGTALGAESEFLVSHGIIRTNDTPVTYWVNR